MSAVVRLIRGSWRSDISGCLKRQLTKKYNANNNESKVLEIGR